MSDHQSLRDKIDPEDADVDRDALYDAWVDRKLTTEGELKSILRNAYAGMEAPHTIEVHRIISRGADIMGPGLLIAESALEAARQTTWLKAIRIAEELKAGNGMNAFVVFHALKKAMKEDEA